jgi:hypothetical protein
MLLDEKSRIFTAGLELILTAALDAGLEAVEALLPLARILCAFFSKPIRKRE